MTTPYDLLRRHCGLSQREAADFHGVSLHTIKDWCGGRAAPKAGWAGVMSELRHLHSRIERTAGKLLVAVQGVAPGVGIEFGLASNDAEAQSLGWPCVGTQAAVLGLVIARTTTWISVVPRGSTDATIEAMAAHFG